MAARRLPVLFAAALAVLSACAETSRPVNATGQNVAFLDRAWVWNDERGTEVTLSRWRGAPLVVSTIFTSCTTRCPLTIEKLRSLDAALRRDRIEAHFALVTIDPQSDDPARLRRFKESRNLPSTWHLLRGTRDQTLELGRMLGLRAILDDGHLDHDVRIALFDAAGRLVHNFAGWDFDEGEAARSLADATAGEGSGELRFAALARLMATGRVRSVDELLPLLPAELRSRQVFLYESRSVQGASYVSPRVLLHTRDAKFVLAYGGDPDLSGYRALETMEFDESKRAFRFREIAFPAGNGAESEPVVSEPNPPRCLACHGEDPRPVWDTYPTWPGAYGEQDHARPEADEAAGLAAFFARRRDNPRYRDLVGVESPESIVPRVDGGSAAYEGKDTLSRNAQFGLLLQELAYRSIAREVTMSPRFAAFRYALLAALDPQCLGVEDFLPEKVKSGFSRRARDFESDALHANAVQAAAKRRRTHARGDSPALTQAETLTPFRYLVEQGLGMSTGGWTLALEKSTYDFTSPRRATSVLERDVLDAVARGDADVRPSHDGGAHRDGYCALLRRRSLAVLNGIRQ